MQIGTLFIPEGAGLSPMAGVTDAAMRLLCCEKGAAWTVSEMLSAKGWIHSRGQSDASRQLLLRLPGEGVGALQLFGREPHLVARAARELEGMGFAFLDLNFGCPAPKITGNGEGSALMREPLLLGRIVEETARAVSIPVTAKIRAGWDETCINAPEVAYICQESGAAAVTVHPRTRVQQYAGRADWSIIQEVVEKLSIPVIGNGDIVCGADALRMRRETGCAAVQIGRAAQGNPWIFQEISAAYAGQPFVPPTPGERMELAARHLKLELSIHSERQAVPEMRKHIAWYASGIRGSAKFRTEINRISDSVELLCAMQEFAQVAERNPSTYSNL